MFLQLSGIRCVLASVVLQSAATDVLWSPSAPVELQPEDEEAAATFTLWMQNTDRNTDRRGGTAEPLISCFHCHSDISSLPASQEVTFPAEHQRALRPTQPAQQ